MHLGVGRFGLGFAVPLARDLRLSSVLVNRPGSSHDSEKRLAALKQRKRFKLRFYDRKNAPKTEDIEFEDLIVLDGVSSTNRLSELLADPHTLILTTAVGEPQIQVIAETLAGALKQRVLSENPLWVLACENLQSGSTFLRKEVERYLPLPDDPKCPVRFANCVVDRICPSWSIRKGTVSIECESYRSLILEDRFDQDTLRERLDSHAGVISLVKPAEFSLYHVRKLWLLNGYHLALAVLGSQMPPKGLKTPIREVLEDQKIREVVHGVREELITAFLELGIKNKISFQPEDLDAYMNTVEQRFSQSQDTCERVLKDALLGEDRMLSIARQIGIQLGEGKPLPELFLDNVYNFTFVFFKKIHDRLYLPLLQLSEAKNRSFDYLATVITRTIPFLVRQMEALREEARGKASTSGGRAEIAASTE